MRAEPDITVELDDVDDIRRVRAAIRAALGERTGLPADHPTIVDALLATSEVVSNAIEHTAGACEIRAWIGNGPAMIRVEVEDDDPRSELVARMPAPDRAHGRGLAIVADVSSRWGSDRTDSGKVVWFEVDTPAT